MADRKEQDQKLDSIKLRVEKEKVEREAAGLPSSPLYSHSLPVARDPEDALADPNAPEHEWMEAAHELNKEEEQKERTQDAELKKHDAFQRKFLIVYLLLIIFLACVGLYVGFQTSHTPIPEYVPPVQQQQQVTKDINFKPYLEAIQKSIKSHWHPPKANDSHLVRVKFKVHKNGEISDLAFDRMSRHPEKDAAVIKAIIESMPTLPPLPEGSPEYVDIMFTFEYNVTNGPANAH